MGALHSGAPAVLRRLALGLEYDGAGFAGWQTQPHGRTVQDVLEAALARFIDAPVGTVCAGRTDAGVHAFAQVVHFDTSVRRPEHAWVRGVNRYLPPQVAVRWAREVAPDFSARLSARARTYDYWILNQPARPALLHARAAWVFRPLDLEAMRAGAAHLVGTHDFSSFRSAECQAASPVRTLSCCTLDRLPTEPLLRVRLSANAFLHHMVRNMVGALVEVGVGRRPSSWIGEVLGARDRTRAAPTFDACGLYLAGVEYDPRFGLPAADAGAPAPAGPQRRAP